VIDAMGKITLYFGIFYPLRDLCTSSLGKIIQSGRSHKPILLLLFVPDEKNRPKNKTVEPVYYLPFNRSDDGYFDFSSHKLLINKSLKNNSKCCIKQ
jgi:hypothetical protein